MPARVTEYSSSGPTCTAFKSVLITLFSTQMEFYLTQNWLYVYEILRFK